MPRHSAEMLPGLVAGGAACGRTTPLAATVLARDRSRARHRRPAAGARAPACVSSCHAPSPPRAQTTPAPAADSSVCYPKTRHINRRWQLYYRLNYASSALAFRTLAMPSPHRYGAVEGGPGSQGKPRAGRHTLARGAVLAVCAGACVSLAVVGLLSTRTAGRAELASDSATGD